MEDQELTSAAGNVTPSIPATGSVLRLSGSLMQRIERCARRNNVSTLDQMGELLAQGILIEETLGESCDTGELGVNSDTPGTWDGCVIGGAQPTHDHPSVVLVNDDGWIHSERWPVLVFKAFCAAAEQLRRWTTEQLLEELSLVRQRQQAASQDLHQFSGMDVWLDTLCLSAELLEGEIERRQGNDLATFEAIRLDDGEGWSALLARAIDAANRQLPLRSPRELAFDLEMLENNPELTIKAQVAIKVLTAELERQLRETTAE